MHIESEILAVMDMNSTFFWKMQPSSFKGASPPLVDFQWTMWSILQMKALKYKQIKTAKVLEVVDNHGGQSSVFCLLGLFFNPQNKHGRFWNECDSLLDYIASHPRRQYYSLHHL
jgi:hypothetical protein